jgi:hypothetical protein
MRATVLWPVVQAACMHVGATNVGSRLILSDSMRRGEVQLKEASADAILVGLGLDPNFSTFSVML